MSRNARRMHKPPAPAPHPEGALQDGACKRSKGPIWTQTEEGHGQRQWQKMGVRVEVKRPPPRKNCSSRRERPKERQTATRQRATTRPRAHQRAATGRHGSPPPCALRKNDPTTPTQSRMPRQTPHDCRAQEGARRPTQRRACMERRRSPSRGLISPSKSRGTSVKKTHDPNCQNSQPRSPQTLVLTTSARYECSRSGAAAAAGEQGGSQVKPDAALKRPEQRMRKGMHDIERKEPQRTSAPPREGKQRDPVRKPGAPPTRMQAGQF